MDGGGRKFYVDCLVYKAQKCTILGKGRLAFTPGYLDALC